MEAVLLIGIPGAGKSTFYSQRFFDTHVRINLDMLKTRRRELLLVQACIDARQPFVVDNTNVLASERARYISLAKPAGFRILGYYFPPDLAQALEHNRLRSGRARIPAGGVVARYRRLEPPDPAEGFDRLYTVRIEPSSGEFIVEEWKIDRLA